MAQRWFIDRRYHEFIRSAAEKLTKDTSGTGEQLYKAMREAAYAYDDASKKINDYEVTEEHLIECEKKYKETRAIYEAWLQKN